jgi:hypothetical protein
VASLPALGGAIGALAVDVLYLNLSIEQGAVMPGARVPFIATWIALAALLAGSAPSQSCRQPGNGCLDSRLPPFWRSASRRSSLSAFRCSFAACLLPSVLCARGSCSNGRAGSRCWRL